MAISYKDVLPLGNGLIIAGVFFFIGVLCGNFPYDFNTLYTQNATKEAFENSLRHYQTWSNIPRTAVWILHSFLGLGFMGMAIKIYKPSEDAKYFEYGSLFLYVIAVCIYLTNLKTGAESAVHGQWGEVDWMTGVNVIAASEAMVLFLLGGIVALQVGLYYANWDYEQRLAVFNQEEAERESQQKSVASAPAAEPVPKATKTASADAPAPKLTPVKTKQTARKATKKA